MATTESTLFSSERFLRAWLSVEHHGYTRDTRIISLPLGASSNLNGVVYATGNGSHAAEFGPHGLFAAPSPEPLESRTLARDLQARLSRFQLSELTWHVRYDHQQLISLLNRAKLPSETNDTHVLSLDQPYDKVFAGYSATRRNQIRKCFRRGVSIRRGVADEDVARYCRMHEALEAAKDFRTRYPVELIRSLVRLDEAMLLLAEVHDQVIAGALFFVDGDTLLYWHGGADREHSEYFPMPALMDLALQQAIQSGLASFNFGGSPSESLRFFKESFGARVRQNWTFRVRKEANLGARIIGRVRRELSRRRR